MGWALRLTLVALAVVSASITTSASTVSAQTGGAIDIVTDPPPGGEDIEIALLDEAGADVTATYCLRGQTGYAQWRVGWTCSGLPDGAYTVQVVDAPADARLSPVDCLSNGVRDDAPIAIIGPTTRHWVCAFSASPPGLLITDETGGATLPRVIDAGGAAVELSCESVDPEPLWANGPTWWCSPLADGSYSVEPEPAAFDDGQRVWCDPELDASGFSSEHGGAVEIGEWWAWSCVVNFERFEPVHRQTVVRVIALGLPGSVDISARLVRDDGTDVTADHCTGTPQPETSAMECTDVPFGVYTVETVGSPEGVRVSPVNCLLDQSIPDAPLVIVAESSVEWNCSFYVSPPVIEIYSPADYQAPPPPVARRPDGSGVDLPCRTDPAQVERAWCFPPGDGTYLIQLPDGGFVDCWPQHGPVDLTSPADEVRISADQWYWGCSLDLAGDQRGQIDIAVQGPLDADVGRVSLRDANGIDVFDQYCHAFGPVDLDPAWGCEGLPFGTFTVEPPVLPDGWRVDGPTCFGATESDVAELSRADNWVSCQLVISPPGFHFSVDDFDRVAPDARIVLVDDSQSLDLPCRDVASEGFGLRRQWCSPVSDGTYDVEVVELPDGYSSSMWCGSPTSLAIESSGRVVVDENTWLWRCQAIVVPDIAVYFDGDSPLYIEAAQFAIVALDGTVLDVDEHCRTIDQNEPRTAARVVHCVGIENGSYSVTARGPGLKFATECFADVAPERWGTCNFFVEGGPPGDVVRPSPSTTTTMPPTTVAAEPDVEAVAEDVTSPSSSSVARSADDDAGDGADTGRWARAGVVGLVVGVVIGVVVARRNRARRFGASRVP